MITPEELIALCIQTNNSDPGCSFLKARCDLALLGDDIANLCRELIAARKIIEEMKQEYNMRGPLIDEYDRLRAEQGGSDERRK